MAESEVPDDGPGRTTAVASIMINILELVLAGVPVAFRATVAL
jgi:hypothetical protein